MFKLMGKTITRAYIFILIKFPSRDLDEDDMQVPIPLRCYTCKFQNWLKSGLKYQNIMNWRPSKTRFNSTSGDFCRLQTV